MTNAHGAFFHSWHWLYQQIQLQNWMGNIVAGIVVFVVIDVAWQWKVKALVNASIHQHFERHRAIQSAKADARQAETHAILDAHHAEHMATLNRHHKQHLAAIRSTKKAV